MDFADECEGELLDIDNFLLPSSELVDTDSGIFADDLLLGLEVDTFSTVDWDLEVDMDLGTLSGLMPEPERAVEDTDVNDVGPLADAIIVVETAAAAAAARSLSLALFLLDDLDDAGWDSVGVMTSSDITL